MFKSKTEYLKKEIKKNVNDVQKMCKFLKSLLPKKSSSFPSILYEDDMVFNNDDAIANSFNDYFIRINAKLAQEMNVIQADEGDVFHCYPSNSVFNFVSINESFVEKLISNLDSNKATGSDDIDIIFFKQSKAFISGYK